MAQLAPCPCCGGDRAPSPGFPEPPYGHTPMRLAYSCPDCGEAWSDEWCSAVDSDCPACGARDITPTEEELTDA